MSENYASPDMLSRRRILERTQEQGLGRLLKGHQSNYVLHMP
jgi:hypothetical protein